MIKELEEIKTLRRGITMNRLTEKRKYPNGYEYQIENLYENTADDCVDKLGKLEDLLEKYNVPNVEYLERCIIDHDKYGELTEQIGCPLDVYVRATIGGIWYSIAGVMKQCYVDTINGSKIIFAMKGTNIWFELSNYKKTWWLKEDRSE